MQQRVRDNQHEILVRIKDGDRLVGPIPRDRYRKLAYTRRWGFASGYPANQTSVNGLVKRGILKVVGDDAKYEAVMAMPFDPYGLYRSS